MERGSISPRRNDIVDVVGALSPAQARGCGAFRRCAHSTRKRRHRSTVNPQRQIFHCFGCGEGATCSSSLMKYENVDFGAAAQMLAQRAGIRLELETARGGRDGGVDKDALFRVHEDVAQLYHRCLP